MEGGSKTNDALEKGEGEEREHKFDLSCNSPFWPQDDPCNSDEAWTNFTLTVGGLRHKIVAVWVKIKAKEWNLDHDGLHTSGSWRAWLSCRLLGERLWGVTWWVFKYDSSHGECSSIHDGVKDHEERIAMYTSPFPPHLPIPPHLHDHADDQHPSHADDRGEGGVRQGGNGSG